MDRGNYDRSIRFLKEALEKAKVGDRDKLEGLRRLDRWLAVSKEMADVLDSG